MDTSAPAQSASNHYPQAAGPIHTIFVLVVLGGWTFYGKSLADSLNPAANLMCSPFSLSGSCSFL
jgi:hypothetical protein